MHKIFADFSFILTLSLVYYVVSNRFKPDLHTIHVRDLNFVLHSRIFMHNDWQLKASNLILGCIPSYTSYQNHRPSLTIGSPLLSYINVRLPGFLSRGLIVGKARQRAPQYIKEGSLVLARDGLVDSIFQGRAEHIPFKDPATAEPNDEMVQRCNMNLRCFFPGTQPAGGQLAPQQAS